MERKQNFTSEDLVPSIEKAFGEAAADWEEKYLPNFFGNDVANFVIEDLRREKYPSNSR
ncbi:hypothetical protein LQ948_15705 [Jiella sp. MQZ9-1]|uniref:Uncharacterized protein n=2 Tax=Jiella flava TaxID=2816857 RepID=A0A939FYU5_9HYPH|nr:hypothetical protein [Jiella flava]MCD2472651.1 hypothetical protein [Jiella flava]